MLLTCWTQTSGSAFVVRKSRMQYTTDSHSADVIGQIFIPWFLSACAEQQQRVQSWMLGNHIWSEKMLWSCEVMVSSGVRHGMVCIHCSFKFSILGIDWVISCQPTSPAMPRIQAWTNWDLPIYIETHKPRLKYSSNFERRNSFWYSGLRISLQDDSNYPNLLEHTKPLDISNNCETQIWPAHNIANPSFLWKNLSDAFDIGRSLR